MTARSIRTLIVDDEPLAREGLRMRLMREPDVEIVGEAIDGVAAIEAIEALTPDLVFLDVQMPGLPPQRGYRAGDPKTCGFDVLDRVSGTHLPIVIFVTAYDQYAIKAFDVHALDYLLKPFCDARFAQALERARRAVRGEADRDADRRVAALLAARADSRTKPYLARLPVKDRDRFLLLRVEEIAWIEAAQNYVQIHARRSGSGAFLIRGTMADLEAQLDPARFARIHRSTLVNLDRIREIRPAWHGDFDVVLDDGTQLKLSRHYRDRLLTMPGAPDVAR